MAFQSVPETAEVTVNYTQGAKPVQMTFHARKAGGYVLTDLQNLAFAVDARVGTSFLPIQTQDVVYNNTQARGLELINDQVAQNSINTGPGQDLSSAVPNSVSYAVKRLSSRTGRSARGRVYWIGIPRDKLDADENYLTGAYSLAVLGAIDLMRQSLASNGWVPVIVSRYTNGEKRPTGITFDWLTTAITDERVDSRRDRMPASG